MWGGIVRLAGHEAAIEIGDPVGLDGKGGLRGNAGVGGELFVWGKRRIF
jgi:hypothetical protein